MGGLWLRAGRPQAPGWDLNGIGTVFQKTEKEKLQKFIVEDLFLV